MCAFIFYYNKRAKNDLTIILYVLISIQTSNKKGDEKCRRK